MRFSFFSRIIIASLLSVVIGLLAVGAWVIAQSFKGKDVEQSRQPTVTEPDRPASKSDDSLRVIALGDIACTEGDIGNNGEEGRLGRCHMRTVAARAIAESADLYLGLGDQQYEEGTREAFQAVFDRIWGSVKDRFFPTLGNHEYKTPKAQGYFDYFIGEGNRAGRAGNRDEGWYRIDRPGWSIFVLNSNCDAVGGCGDGAPQTRWLAEQLATNPQSCSIVTFHHPRWTSGRYLGLTEQTNRSSAWWPLFEKHQVEIVLNGHDHLYERFGRLRADGSRSTEGTRAFTVGTGGKSLYEMREQQPQSDIVIDDHFGYLRLTLDQGSYQWAFVSENGEVRDRGADRCQ